MYIVVAVFNSINTACFVVVTSTPEGSGVYRNIGFFKDWFTITTKS